MNNLIGINQKAGGGAAPSAGGAAGAAPSAGGAAPAAGAGASFGIFSLKWC